MCESVHMRVGGGMNEGVRAGGDLVAGEQLITKKGHECDLCNSCEAR